MKLYRRIMACAANTRGSAFIITLLMFCVVLVLGAGILGTATTNAWMSEADRAYQSAYYIAESGRDTQVAHIQEVIVQKSGESEDADAFFTAMDQHFAAQYPTTVGGFSTQFGEVPQAVVDIEGEGTRPAGAASHTYTLVSQGYVGNIKRQVASAIEITWVENQTNMFNPDVALFSLQDIALSGSSRILGPAGTNATGAGDVSFGWSTSITGSLYVVPGVDAEALVYSPRPSDSENIGGEIRTMPEPRTYELPPYPDVPSLPQRDDIDLDWATPTYTISQDGYYKLIDVNSYTLTINVGSGVRRLVVDDFYIEGNSRVNIVGSGLLELYVTDTFSLKGSSKFNDGGDNKKVILYYGGSSVFSVDGATAFEGCVYVKDADVDIVGSGGVTGHILTGGTSVDITGNASANVRVIYAPKAYVHLSGSGHVTGAVVAESCYLEGDTYISYQADAGAGGVPIPGFGTEGEAQVNIGKPIERDF